MVDGEREDGRRNSVTLFRNPGDSTVNSQVTKSFILVTAYFILELHTRAFLDWVLSFGSPSTWIGMKTYS